jgi:hypothetical protein
VRTTVVAFHEMKTARAVTGQIRLGTTAHMARGIFSDVFLQQRLLGVARKVGRRRKAGRRIRFKSLEYIGTAVQHGFS